MNRTTLLPVAAALAAAVACDGFKEAMTAHVDVVARAGSQELSVERLAELLAASKVPLRRDVAKAVADLWVDYQLLARAAAHGDSLGDPKLIEAAMWAEIENLKAKKWYDVVSKGWVADTATEATYNQGQLLAAQHILFRVPDQGLSQAKKEAVRDSIRRVAESVRARASGANFAELASRHSMDPGSRQQGGYLGVFPRGAMVPEFEKALVALKPGEISPVVESQFGYHIIRRAPYAQARDDFARVYSEQFGQQAEQKYLESLEKAGKVEVRANAAVTVKAVAKDLEAHEDDRTVIATSAAGDFTAGRLARWLKAFPPQAQIRGQILGQPDSVIPNFVRRLVTNELVLRQADSAKIAPDSAEVAEMRTGFIRTVTGLWRELGIAPEMLADSAKSVAERERIASERISQYMDQLLAERVRYVEVPGPVSAVLEDKYDSKINEAGVDRALERATRVRAALDSTRAAQQPPSAVPMPPAVPPGQPRPQSGPPQRP